MDTLVTPIDVYLAAQHDTSAVSRFSQRHDAGLVDLDQRWYADRLPLDRPGPGEQYAFQVDLDRCSGCKACVSACHSLNGLDEGESWRSVGLMVGVDTDVPITQTAPTGCHHCVDPACLSGCPSNAYEKDPFTGIVKHLDDQCIGCGYCELTCPYEVPKLNSRLGIVRKCDMCADRLEEGEAPACVQACPTSAITIAVVDQQAAVSAAAGSMLLPGAPESSITAPTTIYKSRRNLDGVVAADRHAIHLSKSHPPLVAMLVLTQLSVGAFLSAVALEWFGPDGLGRSGAIGAAVAGVLAISASVLHLGRPTVAWRAVLGFGHSWLSREIVAFGVYAALAVGYAASTLTTAVPSAVNTALGVGGAVAGVLGVVCSAWIYVATKRTWWRPAFTLSKFVLTAAVTGPLFYVAVAGITTEAAATAVAPLLGLVVAFAAAIKLTTELALLGMGSVAPDGDLGRTATLLLGPLKTMTLWRFGLGALGGIVLPLFLAATGTLVLALIALVVVVAGELVERYQFFVASVAPRMPGGF